MLAHFETGHVQYLTRIGELIALHRLCNWRTVHLELIRLYIMKWTAPTASPFHSLGVLGESERPRLATVIETQFGGMAIASESHAPDVSKVAILPPLRRTATTLRPG